MILQRETSAGKADRGDSTYIAPRQRPFAAVPHDITADPRLSATDIRVVAALLFWARSRAVCWPSDGSIGKRIGLSVRTVQRSLMALQGAGVIERRPSAENWTGRRIFLRWRGGVPPHDGRGVPPTTAVAYKEDVIPGRKITSTFASPPKSKKPEPVAEVRQCPVAAPPAIPAVAVGPAAEAPPIAVAAPPGTSVDADLAARWERESRLPGGIGTFARVALAMLRSPAPVRHVLKAEDVAKAPPPVLQAQPGQVETADRLRRLGPGCPSEEIAALAAQMARNLDDAHSVGMYARVCREVVGGTLPVKLVIAAYKKARWGTARCPGSVFVADLRAHRLPGN